MNLLDYILGKRYVESQISKIKPEEKTVTPTKSQQIITPTTGKYLSKVTVNTIPSSYIIPSGTVEITENGTHNITKYANVNVNVVSESTLKKLLDTKQSASYLFYYYKGTSIDDLIKYSDTSNVTNMANMFYNCQNLQSIPLLDTSNVINMNNMFYYCQNLQSIPQLNTSKVYNMENMFYNCSKLQTIDLTHMEIKGALSSSHMCDNCYSLTEFIIRNMDTIPPLESNTFNNCYHFTGTRNSTYNPNGLKDGRIYVPDDKVAQLKKATNWSTYASIIVGLSELYTWVTTSQSFSASMTVGFNIDGNLYFGTTEKYSIDLGPGAKNISLSSNTPSAFVSDLADYSYNSTTGILTINRLYYRYPTSSETITVKYDTRKQL